jgi:selenium metabolism protein YedF
MSVIIDARGLTCPQPVILTKKALAKCSKILVLIDDMVALDNVKKLEGVISNEGPILLVISSETMGRGEDVLGAVLMKSFLHTLMETTPMPDIMIFFNTGVKLAAQGSVVLEDLDALSKAGVRILVCGTCLNYFGLKDKLQAGTVSNMYDIAQTMFSAGRLVQI